MDLDAVQALYQSIRANLAATVDFPHWHSHDHPASELVEAWIAQGDLFLAVAPDGELAGAVALDHSSPDGYRDAAWAVEASGDEVLVVHVLGVSPSFLRRGVARFLLDGSVRIARERGCRAVRLDVYEENPPARALYASYGFTDLGVHIIQYPGMVLNRFHLFEYVL